MLSTHNWILVTALSFIFELTVEVGFQLTKHISILFCVFMPRYLQKLKLVFFDHRWAKNRIKQLELNARFTRIKRVARHLRKKKN